MVCAKVDLRLALRLCEQFHVYGETIRYIQVSGMVYDSPVRPTTYHPRGDRSAEERAAVDKENQAVVGYDTVVDGYSVVADQSESSEADD